MSVAPAPPPITLQDLDREELLQLLSGRLVSFTVADLWSARWDVLCKRTERAQAEANAAFEQYLDCAPKREAGARLTQRQVIKELQADEAARAVWVKAKARAERARAAEDRAWKALQTIWGRTAA